MFGKSKKTIATALDGLKKTNMYFTVEEDVYAFLGVEVSREGDSITQKQ